MPVLLNATPGFASVNSCAICNRFTGPGTHICEAPAYPTMPGNFPQPAQGITGLAATREKARLRNEQTLGRYLKPSGEQVSMYKDKTDRTFERYLFEALDDKIAKAFDYALTNLIAKDQSGMKAGLMGPNGKVAKVLIRDFVMADKVSQYAIIDTFFNATVMWAKPDKPMADMYEPDTVVANQSLMTSGQVGKTKALKDHGIGFRCEQLRDLNRIKSKGFEPLYKSLAIAEGLGQHITRTIMDRAVNNYGDMGLFLCNKDAVGETAICLSRNMRGAGKFPTPEMVCHGVLFAAKPKPKTLGFDTEKWQIDQRHLDKTALWRPGEKLFPKIGTDELLAYVNIRKQGGGGEANYYTFEIPDTQWTPLDGWPRATIADRNYLKGELDALRAINNGRIVVPKDEDFAV